MKKTKKVLIIQEVMKQYRLPFHEHLHGLCAERGVEVQVVYSAADGVQQEKSDNIELPAKLGQRVKKTIFFKKSVYQHCLSQLFQADLVIVEQANRHVLNYLLIILKLFRLKRFAFWGHGRNFQADRFDWKEKLKRKLVSSADWWFSYTSDTASYVAHCGFPKQRITVVENSIDISEFQASLKHISEKDIDSFKVSLGIPRGHLVGIFCGSMYQEKELLFLCESLILIKQQLPDFSFIFVGAGSDQYLVEDFCLKHSWAHYAGPAFGDKKSLCFATSDIALNPGLVGLGVLDAFAAGIVIATTEYPKHSPEVAYIESGYNGISTAFSVSCFSGAVVDLLQDKLLLRQCSKNALTSSGHYSIENMANNFAGGIFKALSV